MAPLAGPGGHRGKDDFPWWLVALAILGVVASVAIAANGLYAQIFSLLLNGIGVTVFVTLVAFTLAMLFGLGLALLGLSDFLVLRQVARFYIEIVRGINDPVGTVTERWQRPNGMFIERVRVPLGVAAVIFESRPNVLADAGALCLKSGNAVILRGGSDSFRSCRAIHQCLVQGLREAKLPEEAITLVPTRDRAAVGLLLTGLGGGIDVIVPRGGKSLVARVEAEARVPVFAHLEGVNHVYVDKAASLDMAKTIVLNAKMRRPGICGAAETLLVDKEAAPAQLKPLVEMLIDAGCEVRGDDQVQRADARVKPATDEDWATEYEDAIIAARVVDGLDDAIAHIETYGSHHTDAIVTEDAAAAARFLNEVDSAIVLHNASTQFADGGEFGFGAEIGIATGKFHARGPVGVDQLTSFKYRVHGTGQTRP